MILLLTGIDGYVGWPTALRLSKEFPEARIIGIDNMARRRWVEEVGSVSAIPIAHMDERILAAKERGFPNVSFIEGDLTNRDFVYQIFGTYKFDVILHIAAQPSAPYSQINGERANYTQFNNNQSTRNLLWAVREHKLEERCHFIETTTTGVYGAPEFKIPEGFVVAENEGERDLIPLSNMAGSWYHMSKSNDINNLWLANKLWSLSITDLRTAIVYGVETEETKLDKRLATRFDFDFFFGIVVNRFCAMVLAEYPITIYGKGEQKKPIISLEDCVESIVNAVRLKPAGEFKVYNQVTEVASIIHVAQSVVKAARDLGMDGDIKHIPNPRVEKEEHQMSIDTKNFSTLLKEQKWQISSGSYHILRSLLEHQDLILQYRDRFLTT